MTRKRTRGCDEPDEPIYVRINEVWHFHGRGFSEADIARWLYLPLEDVEAIIDDPRAYMVSHGVPVKSVNHIDRLPTPAEIRAAAGEVRERLPHLRKDGYVRYAVLDKIVYSPHRRRCGY